MGAEPGEGSRGAVEVRRVRRGTGAAAAALGDQRGSTMPVLAALLLVAVLVAAAAMEREWANYMQRLAEATADFAAESGAQYHQVFALVRVQRSYVRRWEEEVCQPPATPEGDPECHAEVREETVVDVAVRKVPEAELRAQGVPALFGCQLDPYRPWVCGRAEVLARCVEFAPEAVEWARRVFQANWTDRRGAVARVWDVWARNEAKQVEVVVALDLESLFGFWPIRHRVAVAGRGGVRLGPLPGGLVASPDLPARTHCDPGP